MRIEETLRGFEGLHIGGEAVRRPLPENTRAEEGSLFAADRDYVVPHMSATLLRGVTVSPRGFMFRHGRLLIESFVVPEHGSWQRIVLESYAALKLIGKRPEFLAQGVWITDNWSAEYYHWICDALPRLYAVALAAPSELPVVLPATHWARPYVEPSLKPFSPLRGYRAPDSRLLRVDRLLLPDHAALTGNVNPTLMQGIGKLFRKYFGSSEAPFRRIYVSRSCAPRRRVSNEAALAERLHKLGFEVINFEDYAFEEQIRMMSETQIMVSIHGAGLANMAFMPPGGIVVELKKAGESRHNCFFNLAAAVHMRYRYLQCQPENPDEPVWTANLIVDPAALDNVVTRALSSGHDK